jgi:uncharacterized protein
MQKLIMNNDILNIISEFKDEFSNEGFLIEGIFDSYSRGDFTKDSDIDILYDLKREFKDKYKDFKAIARLDAIQIMISKRLNIDVDLVQRSTLGEIGIKYILPEVCYV